MTPLDNLTTTLTSNTRITLTDFQSSLNSFLNRTCLNLTECESNEQIVKVFSEACGDDIERMLGKLYANESLNLLDKSTEASDAFRTLGNEHYKRKRVREALRSYTLAAAFAPTGSTSLALAYSNRSACFYTENSYEKSLADITRFESTYPSKTDKVASKLSERKQKCLEKIKPPPKEQPLCEHMFTLKSKNDKIPSAESFIGLSSDDKRGRHVINSSDRTIPPGELIILEPPFTHILLRVYSFEYKHCVTCLKDLDGGGVPCEACVFAIYCSENCKTSTPHTNTECKISKYLHELKPDRTVHLALSTLLKLKDPDLETKPKPEKIIQYPYTSTTYPEIENLIYHRETLTNKDLTQYSAYAEILTKLVEQKTTHFTSTQKQHPFKHHLLLHQMNFPCNAHSLYKLNLKTPPTKQNILTSEYEEIGAGAYSLLSMINHSCDPNIVRITLTSGITAVLTLHNIPPRSEILDNYGSHFATTPLKQRQAHLTSLYNFPCDCTPCTQNWPQIESLLKTNDNPICNCNDPNPNTKCPKCNEKDWNKSLEQMMITYKSSESSLLENNPTKAFKEAKEALTFFDSSFKKPSKLVCIPQEYLKQALFLISRSVFR